MPGQCTSGFCTDGVCCESSSCPSGQRCDIFGKEGRCSNPAAAGQACIDDTDCADGLLCRTSSVTGGLLCTPIGGTCSCVGDCNCDGEVTIDEIITMVNIALGILDIQDCPSGDANHDGEITVEEIVNAVINALNNCPLPATPVASPTATATATSTSTAKATAPPGNSVSHQASGSAVALSRSLPAIPAVLSALTQLAGGGRSANARALTTCSAGGTRDFTCTQTIPASSPRNYSLAFNGCVLGAAGGGTVSLQGNMSGQSTETGFLATCSLPPLSLSTLTINNVEVVAKNSQATTTLTADFNLTGSASVTPDLASACRISAFALVLSGSASVQAAGRDISLGFHNTQMNVEIQQFSTACVPVQYRITINGMLDLTDQSSGQMLSGNFTNFVVTDDTTGGNDVVTLTGKLNSTCLGTEVTYTTSTALVFPVAAACPNAGVLLVADSVATDRLTYSATGGVDIDLGNNGGAADESYASCLALGACPAGP